jgi:hypothetical protein
MADSDCVVKTQRQTQRRAIDVGIRVTPGLDRGVDIEDADCQEGGIRVEENSVLSRAYDEAQDLLPRLLDLLDR